MENGGVHPKPRALGSVQATKFDVIVSSLFADRWIFFGGDACAILHQLMLIGCDVCLSIGVYYLMISLGCVCVVHMQTKKYIRMESVLVIAIFSFSQSMLLK